MSVAFVRSTDESKQLALYLTLFSPPRDVKMLSANGTPGQNP
jgi:hypothetical protein